jgi:GNAT superfamily N-acetyltransferase
VTATVGDCELTQAAWNAAIAVAGGGEVWEDSGLRWSWQAHDGQLMLSFPRVIDEAAARRGVEVAHDRGACIVGAWLAADVEASPLEAVGFERGWEPWWMTAPLDAIPDNGDDRVTISAGVPEYGPEGQRLLTMARGPDARTWHALARVDGRFAGRAWSFAPGPIAGIFDMFVVAQFQRRGLGRALLRAICAAARAHGARAAVLNATPDGERLYSAEGFRRIGTGITYWHHLACPVRC